jgi:multidrug efflux pump subunit AcrA (membrane-fusion protein)
MARTGGADMKLNDIPASLKADPRAGSGTAESGVTTADLLGLQALALRHERFDAAAAAIVGDLALRLSCTRVSLAWRDASRPNRPAQVAALSNGADPDARRQAVRRLAEAADEALDHGQAVAVPVGAGAATGPTVAHAALIAASDAQAVLSVPFDIDGPAPGVLIFESAQPLGGPARTLALDAALFVGPVLMLKARLDAPWRTRALALVRGNGARAEAFGAGRIAVAAGVVGIAAAAFWPSTYHVVAQARVEGLGQRVVTAPADGFLHSVAVRPGEPVKAGQLLATLDDKEPLLEAERAGAERAQADRLYRDAMAGDDAGQIVVARAKLEQAQAQHDLAQRRLDRTRLVAPFDGQLIGGDLGPSIGMPVKRGQELMIVAPSTGWRLVAEVDEQDVASVHAGQKAQVLFAALSGRTTEFQLTRVSPVSVQTDGRNVFEAEGQLGSQVDGLRPGLRGVARIAVGQRSLAAVWWDRSSGWLRRAWWTLVA